jgi:hypothetical protein
MKLDCSPDWNFESRLDPDSPPEVVVVVELGATVVVVAVVELEAAAVVCVVEPAGVVVVVVLVLELLQPAATIATVVANASPAAMRFQLRLVVSLITWILRPNRVTHHRRALSAATTVAR